LKMCEARERFSILVSQVSERVSQLYRGVSVLELSAASGTGLAYVSE
jgi:hypothetical protein